jgi:hypothetical protein
VLKFLNQTIYVQVTKNAFSILHVQTNKQTVVQAASPFSTERLGVGHFNQAAEALAKELPRSTQNHCSIHRQSWLCISYIWQKAASAR